MPVDTGAFIERMRPAGGRRSSKRDLIVNVFLRQEGHLSADHLVDLIKREDQKISRATVYRTLQWMVDAGIARKVDFGEGRFRFEHSYRHPRHFHLICKSCNQTFEFLSSDIESLIEEVAAARNFAARQSVLQIYGTCETCQTGRPADSRQLATDLVFSRDALRIAIATERSGREFYGRAAKGTPSVMDYKLQAEADSMLNTPATYSLYVAGLVFKWLKQQGGLASMERKNVEKAKLLYDYLDSSEFFDNPVAKEDRSRMNVPFTLKDKSLDETFLKGAAERGLIQLKGHRSVGGMRASIYNAMPLEGVHALVDYLREFEKSHA